VHKIVLIALGLCLTARPLLPQDIAHPRAVVVAGEGRQWFVLVSGMVGGVAGFRRLQALLVARGNRVIVVDPYALSLDSADVSFSALARRLDVVLARYHVTEARVVGHAQGACVALRLAASVPERVAALYLLDSGGLPMNRGPTLSASLRLVPLITRLPGGHTLLRDRFLAGIRRNAARQDWLDLETQRAYTEPLLASIDQVVAMAVRLGRAEEPEPLASVVAQVRMPVTVILGAAPHEADAGPEELIALAPLGSQLHIERLAGVGHFPHEEAPNELLPLITAPCPGA